MNRRSLLKFIGASPITAPLAAKHLQDTATANLSNLEISGLKGNDSPTTGMSLGHDQKSIQRAMQLPWLKEQVREALYQQEQRVFSLDHDLASCRSFSLAAKITYQRRRNVERRLIELEGDTPAWNKVSSLIEGALSKLLK